MVVARVSGRGGGVDRRGRRQHSAHGHRRGCGVCGLGGGPVRCQRPLPPHHLALHHSSSVDAGLDHSMIFLLIAGTYTPIAMLARPPGHPHRRAGRGLGRAVAGMMLKLVWPHAPRWVSVLMYLVLGWVPAFVFPELAAHAGPSVLALLLTDGLLYTTGAFFYTTRWPDPWPPVLPALRPAELVGSAEPLRQRAAPVRRRLAGAGRAVRDARGQRVRAGPAREPAARGAGEPGRHRKPRASSWSASESTPSRPSPCWWPLAASEHETARRGALADRQQHRNRSAG